MLPLNESNGYKNPDEQPDTHRHMLSEQERAWTTIFMLNAWELVHGVSMACHEPVAKRASGADLILGMEMMKG